jgi:hypothetical protein
MVPPILSLYPVNYAEDRELLLLSFAHRSAVTIYLTQTGLSDNVGGVKQFLGTLLYALEEERHFALVDGSRFANRRLAS